MGGPIKQDRTFFWFSKDDYMQKSTRNNVLTFPTMRERAGDFSQSPATIYDPLTTRPNPNGTGFIRDPFPGNVIPADRINPISLAMLTQMPTPTSGRSFNGSAILEDGPQDQETLKIDHRWGTKWTTTGMYAHQQTGEPGSAFWGTHGTIPADPSGTIGYRTIHFFSTNQIIVPNNSTALAVRYGYYYFLGDGTNYAAGFDAATLGYPTSFTSVLTPGGYPATTINGYSNIGHGGRNITLFEGHTGNATLTKFKGSHSFKVGVDYRRLSGYSEAPNNGNFGFTQAFTQGPNPNTASSVAGDAFASFLLGYPATGDVNVATPGTYYTDYYSAFAQDDYRISSKLTLNFGLRYEYEPGVSARDDRFTVGFDRDALFPVQVPGMELRGGLMYAGVDGYPTRQQQPLNKVAPRGGFAYSMTEKTVLRGGYGLYWVPPITDIAEAMIGSRGYSASTTFLSSTDGGLTPVGSLSNPYPAGITRAPGQLARPGHRRGQRDRLRRPGLQAWVRAPVLARLAARAGGRHVDCRGLHGQPIRAAAAGRHRGRHGEHQPARSAVPGARHGAAADRAEPVLRQRRVREPEPVGDDLTRAAAAAVPAVRQRAHAPRQPGQGTLQRPRHALEQAAVERLRARHQPHLQPPRGQPVRREQHVLQPAAGRVGQLRPRRRVRRVAPRRGAPAQRQRHGGAALR